jgi:ABC-type nitrate/sulfonate/bicarbonate transport system permease component
MRLIDNAGREFHRLWTIRVSLWFGVFTGIAAGLNAFVDMLNPYLFLALSVIVNVALIPLARLSKQGEPDGE